MTLRNIKVYDPEALGLEVVRMAGEEAICRCFREDHNDSNPSSCFNVVNGAYYCFGCKHSGNAESIAQYTGGLVQKILANNLPQASRKDRHEWKWVMNRPLALDNKYLISRGIPNDVVRHFKIRDCHIGIGVVMRDFRGKPQGAQIRKYDGNYGKYLLLGERPPFWPSENAAKGVYITEGVFGVINAHKQGIQAISALGAGIPRGLQDYLKPLAPIAVFDNDFPGYVGAGKIVYRCHGRAIVPGLEADEANWSEVVRRIPTGNLLKIAKESGDKHKFMKQVIRE